MGCHLEVWRQRIGLFRMPSSKAARSSQYENEFQFDHSSWSLGPGLRTFCAILIAVTVGMASLHLLPQCSQLLSACNDVEANPGPVPLLSDELLQKLVTNNLTFGPLGHTLKNKHIYQLMQLRNEQKKTWSDLVLWLKLLLPNFPEGEDWPKRISNQSKSFFKTRQGHMKNKSRSPDDITTWEDSEYSLPSLAGKRQPPFKETESTIFEYEVLKTQSKKLQQENSLLKEENNSLRERPSPHKLLLQQRRQKYQKTQTQEERTKRRSLEKDLEKITMKKQKFVQNFSSVQREAQKLTDELESRKQEEQDTAKEAEHVIETLQKLVNDQEERIKELLEYNSKLKGHQSDVVNMMDGEDGFMTYKSDVRKCVYSLLDHNVGFDNVGRVIETVLRMIGKVPDNTPTGRTVANMNRERLLLAQKQLEELVKHDNLTIGTDETPKGGDIFMAYTMHDSEGSSYVLGMREMISKSAENTLGTLKLVLDDISSICSELSDGLPGNDVGLEILTKIKNTMSDRAATECLFNVMLKTFREECLPLYKEGWQHFNESTKAKLTE
eukprot:XP_011673380.1 PREDICTED: uncharacterized protein LOC105442707 [Strongylocentrotus purpuratus]